MFFAACDLGHWGPDCALTCNCSDSAGGCSAESGQCLCEAGFTGSHCEHSECSVPCPSCPDTHPAGPGECPGKGIAPAQCPGSGAAPVPRVAAWCGCAPVRGRLEPAGRYEKSSCLMFLLPSESEPLPWDCFPGTQERTGSSVSFIFQSAQRGGLG